MGLSCDECAFVAREINDQRGNFFRRSDAAHRLARNELFAGFFVSANLFTERVESIL